MKQKIRKHIQIKRVNIIEDKMTKKEWKNPLNEIKAHLFKRVG